MSRNVGAAIKITKDNHEKLTVLNGGVAPEMEDVTTYFLYPYNPDAHCRVLPADVFFENYRFAPNQEDETCLVDIDEI